MRRTSVILATIASALLIAACGSSSSGDSTSPSAESTAASDEAAQAPPASGTVDEWITGFKHASASGLCDKWIEIGFTGPCEAVDANFGDRKVVDSDTFGPGAVVDLDDGESAILFVQDGNWSLSSVQRFGHASVGTVAEDPEPFQASVDAVVDGIRTKDCKELFHYAATRPGESAQSFCETVFKSSIAAGLSADSEAEFTSYGGTADVQFYGAPVTLDGKTLFITYPVFDPSQPAWDLTGLPATTPPAT